MALADVMGRCEGGLTVETTAWEGRRKDGKDAV